MALTAKPISTISYNSEQFLERLLNRLLSAHVLEDFRYIKHQPEEDEEKEHFHICLFPNKRIDTAILREEFNEVDPTNEKPLGCLPFRTCKTDHWIMYVLHDEKYLAIHHSDNDGDGKIPYELSDIKTPFEEQLRRDHKKALALRQTKNQQAVASLLRSGSITDTILTVDINPMQAIAISNALKIDATQSGPNAFLTNCEKKAIAQAFGLSEDQVKVVDDDIDENGVVIVR